MEVIGKDEKFSINELNIMAKQMFGNLVKAVVDVEREMVVLDAELHSDEEAKLLESGSKQDNLWGINLYPEFFLTDDFLEFDSMINLRPAQNNRSRGVESEVIREKIKKIIANKIKDGN